MSSKEHCTNLNKAALIKLNGS